MAAFETGRSRRDALQRARLYLVAPAMPSDVLDAVLAAGVGVLQLRDKHAEPSAVLPRGLRFSEAAGRHRVPFVLNDRADLAHALKADGVHLGQDDLPPAVARELLGPDVVIGRSTHSTDQIDAAVAEHGAGIADYIAVGPVYPTPTKQGRPAVGLGLVAYAAAHVPESLPWFAIGGIDIDTVGPVAAAGAQRVVVVRAITQAPDPAAAAGRLLGALTG